MNIIQQFKDADGNNIFPLAYAQGGMKMDLLWTNPNPTSAFAAQTVNLDLSEYELIYIDFIYAISYGDSNKNITSVCSIKTSARAVICAQGVGAGTNQRKFDISDVGIYFYSGNASGNNNDSVAVPYQIYGIKMSYIVPTSVHGLQYVEV